jgi:predicted Rossmann fold nucleotide-binding protein DprA/Smf involved in DNA uptake
VSISVRTQAILLLTAHLGRPAKEDPRPLSPAEWGRLAPWIEDRGIPLEALLTEEPTRLLAGWVDGKVTPERVRYLLGRAATLGLAMERWQRAGLWILTLYDAEYPAGLKRRLKTDSPPILFGCGAGQLLNRGGIAIVGSRDAGPDDLAFAARLGEEVARQGLPVVSGGARGVDDTAMLGALEREGEAVAVLADGLLRAATSARYRKALMARRLALVSSFNPEAGFEVGNAMARNRYIYCLSDAAVVVSSGRGKGGTWNGAIEALKHRWVPVWVKPDLDGESGNAELARRGARRLPEGEIDLPALLSPDPAEGGEGTHGADPHLDRPEDRLTQGSMFGE